MATSSNPLHQGPPDTDLLHQQIDSTDMLQQHTQTENTGMDKRLHIPTEKAQELFESEIMKHAARLSRIMREIDELLLVVQSTEADQHANAVSSLRDTYKRYSAASYEFKGYLQRQNSLESARELASHKLTAKAVRQRLDTVFGPQLSKNDCKTSTSAQKSKHSKTSTKKSSASMMLARQKARLNGARVNLEFASREADLLKEKARLEAETLIKNADIEATLKNLKAEKDTKVASVEMNAVLEELEDSEEDYSDVSDSSVHLRTVDYVHDQNHWKVNTGLQSQHPDACVQAPHLPVQDLGSHIPRKAHLQASRSFDVQAPNRASEAHLQASCLPDEQAPYVSSEAYLQAQRLPYVPVPSVSSGVRLQALHSSHVQAPYIASEAHLQAPGLPIGEAPFVPSEVHIQAHRLPDVQTHSVPSEAHLQALHPSHGQAPDLPAEAHLQALHVPHVQAPCNWQNPAVQATPPSYPNSNNHGDAAKELSKYLIKRELVTDRLLKFTDKPETYLSWKGTFKDVIKEIGAKPSEEIDLMVKWLGPQSSSQVASIKTANTGDHVRALTKAWERIDTFYGSPERVEHALKLKLCNTPKLSYKDKAKFYELSDTLNEILAVKEDVKYSGLLSYFDTSIGVNPVIQKLPASLQNKWRDRAMTFKRTHGVAFPPFSFFCTFVQEMAMTLNDPGFDYVNGSTDTDTPVTVGNRKKSHVSVHKTSVTEPEQVKYRCLIHNAGHSTNECRVFKAKSISERRDLLRKHGHCFKCCDGKHRKQECKESVKCDICNSKDHATGMHRPQNHGGEKENVTVKCTEVCGTDFQGKSCAKIVLVTIRHKSSKKEPIRAYAILDEQSNRSLGRKELFDTLDPYSASENYLLSTCSGKVETSGRQSSSLIIESIDGATSLKLPTIIECDAIPNNREEIPTPEVAINYQHLADISNCIPPLEDNSEILLLIGRDMLPAHHVLEQRIGPPEQPYAQKLHFGWVIIGESCLNGRHAPPSTANVMKTLLNPAPGHDSILSPCDSKIRVSDIFHRTENDNKPGMSVEDKAFSSLMDDKMRRDETGHWIAPLPFKENRSRLPNNRKQAMDRAKSLDESLRRNPVKREHFLEFMKGLMDSGHAELTTTMDPTEECWYLPLFGVYHPQKKDRIRGVFDSSAKVQGISLNSVLMTGPDLLNSLLGVLLRFRKETVAITADIQQMFYCFFVHPDHRKYLRFIWHKDNDVNQPLVDYQMKVHVFGNSPSPAVATFGLRRTADVAEQKYGTDVKHFVHRNFYVDDALSSHPSGEEAIDILSRTCAALKEFGNLRLHKIASNSSEVLSAFKSEELAQELKNIELGTEGLPSQRSLGIRWDLQADEFMFHLEPEEKPFTRRCVLSCVNSVFDPLGFLAPVTIAGKAILREAMSDGADWDEPLRPDCLHKWEQWKSSLQHLRNVRIQRTYGGMTLSKAAKKELCIFSDASEKAIAAVVYIKLTDSNGYQSLGFVLGKAKLAPKHGHTIPRLELCGAVLATELYETVRDEMDIKFDNVQFYTDSRVILGYIRNETKRFYIYVENRVERIRRCSNPKDWNYICSKLNPADEATRSVTADNLQDCMWLKGPTHLLKDQPNDEEDIDYPLVTPEEDREVRTLITSVWDSSGQGFDSSRFDYFSSWHRLARAIANVKHLAARWTKSNVGQQSYNSAKDSDMARRAERFIIKVVQSEAFHKEIQALGREKDIPRNSSILNLDPYLDEDGLLCVGGRLKNSNLPQPQKHPVILPKTHHVTRLIVAHYHQEVQHQGRLFTEGAIRNAGYWIVGCRRLVNTHLRNCVKCLKLRGKQHCPKMADLPPERLDLAPPFSYVGIDVFGPWTVVTRKTRGGQAHSKRWALILTCLLIRAIHIEVMEEMTTSSFINALRRFTALRGEVKFIRSDCGSNFVGAAKELNATVINTEDPNFQSFLTRKGITWRFNPPHSSHMGGVWERLIGVSRRILDALLMDVQSKHLTHEVLVTFMAEVCSIVNSRPIAGVSADPMSPAPLTPNTLLSLKTTHTVDFQSVQDFTLKDIYKAQWRCVQHLANCFWKRWKGEYLSSLQERRKWQDDSKNLQEGDVVLLRDKSLYRNEWPMGVVTKANPSGDGRVRKIEVSVGTDRKVYSRPVSEVVLLVSKN